MLSAKSAYFRSLIFGYNAPPNLPTSPGCVLWFRVRITGHLIVIAELMFKQMVESEVADHMRRIDGREGFPSIGYTVANPELFSKAPSHYKGFMGQSIAESFSAAGISLTPGDDDHVNGFARIQSLLRKSPSGEPWLTIDPTCTHLIQQLETAMSDESKPDEVVNYAPAVHALRLGVMSRPSPITLSDPLQDPPYGTPAWFMKQAKDEGTRRFGQAK